MAIRPENGGTPCSRSTKTVWLASSGWCVAYTSSERPLTLPSTSQAVLDTACSQPAFLDMAGPAAGRGRASGSGRRATETDIAPCIVIRGANSYKYANLG